MRDSPTTPTYIAVPSHEHQPLLLQEAAGLRTWAFYYATAHTGFSGPVEIRSITHANFGQVNTQLIFFEYHSMP
jgi:hypothetical protein